MPLTAVQTTTKPNAAAQPKALPPARSFAKQPVSGRKLVRLGPTPARGERGRFTLPQEFRRPPAVDYFSPTSRLLPFQSSINVGDFPKAELDRETTLDITGAHRRPSAVIQYAQLPTYGPVVPPAVPLRRRAGKAATSHELKKMESISINSPGAPLPAAIRNPLAHTFEVDLTPIRVHTDAGAQRAVKSISTRAFAYGNHILLGPGEQPTDLPLMAHEVAHVVQQSGGVTLQHFTPSSSDPHEKEAERAATAAVRGEKFKVQQKTKPRPQGIGLKDIGIDIEIPDPLDWLANKANVIPGFRMFTIVLGVNPINMSAVDRSAANILRALIEFLPGGGLITQALDNSGVFEKAGAFVEQQIASLGLTGEAIKSAVTQFIDRLSLKRIVLEPGTVWEEAKSIFTGPIDQIINFAIGLVGGIIDLIKDAILKPIAKMAEGTEGYNLLKGILGKDPITGEAVTPSAETLLGPLLKMIGLGDVWQKMQDAKAIPRAWAWFQTTMSQLFGFVSQIPDLFISAFKALTIEDIILVTKAFAKLAGVFGGFMSKFVSWGLDAMFKLLEIVFDVVSPGAFGYIKKTGAALKAILQNPLPFVGNLVKAAKLGFTNFAGNILGHLKKGLIDWLTGSLEGVYIPTALTLLEFGKMAISILGVTWAQIRGKIVKALGPNGEMIMKGLEAAFDVVKALITGGPKAAWEVLKDKLTDLKDTIVQGIISFVTESIVTKAVPKLIAMFIPGAGFISAIISIYDTVMVFVNKISKIIQVVTAFINSIVAIAAGNIGAAAAKVESILGGLLSLAISFLAGFVGLGKVTNKIMEVVKKVRAAVDKAIETAVNWIINKAKSLFASLFGGKDKKGDSPASAAVKAKVRADLAGKSIQDAKQADALIGGVYQRFSSQGLKGIRLTYNPSNPTQVSIKASASAVDEVANLPINAGGAREALDYAYRFKLDNPTTSLYVYYDADNKRFGQVINNEPELPGNQHAEDMFAPQLPGLISAIRANRKSLKTPADQRVKIALDLNRLPCPRCSGLIARWGGTYPDVQFIVRASSASTSGTVQKSVPPDSQIHIEFIETMIRADVQVEPLKIHEAIWKKLQQVALAAGAGKVRLRTESLAVEVTNARDLIARNAAETRKVEGLIEAAKRKAALPKVPPKGTGV
jgi:Domain of unknown function (DUF4157)